jgi:hypothetical protein
MSAKVCPVAALGSEKSTSNPPLESATIRPVTPFGPLTTPWLFTVRNSASPRLTTAV